LSSVESAVKQSGEAASQERAMISFRITLAVAVLLLLTAAGVRAADAPADLVVLNGKVLTVDPKFSTAEAVAVRGGVFVRVGTTAEVKQLVGDKTRVIDAKGKSVIPGLIESHIHAVGAARGEVVQPFVQLGSIAEMQEWVRDRVKAAPEGTWIQLPRADVTRIRERRMPTRAELDAAAPNHPVVFNWQYAGRQVLILNGAALTAAGITRDTPDPKGGKVVKGDDGEPTGVVENPAASSTSSSPRSPSRRRTRSTPWRRCCGRTTRSASPASASGGRTWTATGPTKP
jgi:predicted amidohydrolase YtcJ